MNTQYAIDLSINPTTFDLWHVSLAGAVVALLLALVMLLVVMVASLCKKKPAEHPGLSLEPQPPEPIIKIVEKIVEVEKQVPAPMPEPVVLKEATPDAALQLLGLLQKEARFIDFIKEEITAFSDAEIGVVARVVHEGCHKVLAEHFTLAPVRSEQEGAKITVPPGFDASQIRLTGNIVGHAPFTGTLIHKGWQATRISLPKLTQGFDAKIVAAAEVEL